MNRWSNAGGSIDGHLPIAWKVPYKRVYPRLKAGDPIDASIAIHGEGCMPQAAALKMSLRVPVRNEWTEWPRTVQTIVSIWRPTGSASSPSGVFPGPRGGEVAVNLALPGWCAMRDQEPAPSGPWSGSAYWTHVSEPVLLRASPVCPCIPGPAKRRLGLRELG